MRDPDLRTAWRPEIDAGTLAICALTEIEYLYSARSSALLHYDGDFVQVAALTGQPVCWLAEPGSVA